MLKKLDHPWILWYDKKNQNVGTDDWDKFLIRICFFEKIDSFCSLLGRIIPLSQLPSGASYHFFKQGIEPRWEDKYNSEGGRWNLILQKQNLSNADKIWYLTITSVLGGSFGKTSNLYINGIVGTVKKGQIRIAIWTRQFKNEELQLNIGKNWKKLIQESMLIEKFVIEFFPHKTNISKK